MTSLDHLPATVPEALRARVGHPDDPFVVGPGFRLTFGEADVRSRALAARLLAAGVGKGTHLGLLYGNSSEWVVAWLAAGRSGALTVPLSTFAPGTELARTIRHCDVHAVLTGHEFAGASLPERLQSGLEGLASSGPELGLDAAPFLRWIHVEGSGAPWSRSLERALPPTVVAGAEQAVTPSDLLVIVTTSGTTAEPKAVVHTHGSLVRHAALLADRRGPTREDRIYSPMPFFWVGGLTMVVLAALTSGAGAVVQERFEPGEALTLMARERVTQIACWPNAARAIADHPSFATTDLSAVRGGPLIEALPPHLRPTSPDLAPTVLGMSETGGPHTAQDDGYAPLPEHQRGSYGRSLPGMEHRVVDVDTGAEVHDGRVGELLVRGPYVMDGLYKRERSDTFTPEGWYATGDLARIDADGLVYFEGRRTTMIKTGGSNVSPAEVEAALCDIDGVAAAFVFGVPAGARGEDVAAVVVTVDGPIDADQLVAEARRRLSSFKVPRRLVQLAPSDVPVLPTGKPDVPRIRALLAMER
jgi:acyl-CoA synthetase (AMP-forming)/AMP-acid ligase II